MSFVTTSDAQAIALLCAPLTVGDAKALSVTEWAKLAATIHGSNVGRPASLLGMSAADLQAALAISPDDAGRIALLLDRGGPLAFEQERLADRGIRLITRADDGYPARLRRRLGLKTPPVLFVAGSLELARQPAVALVGSREASAESLAVADSIGRQLARENATVVSGGARGIDRAAMTGSIDAGGGAFAFVADNLARHIQNPDIRRLLADDMLALLTPFAPDVRFLVGNAMARNKLIYCAADAAIVVSTADGSGGTWAGAIEALKVGWVPVWAWTGASAPAGNAALVRAGARALDDATIQDGSLYSKLRALPAPDLTEADEIPGKTDSDLFRLVWPRVREYLEAPRAETDLCDRFQLERTQVRAWMTRAIASGWVVKQTRPVRYVLADAPSPDQDTLFE